MKIKSRVAALVASVFAASASVDTQAAQFSSVVVFGDSLSDAGYYRGFLASLGLPAAQMGRFSTNPGPVWSELISQYYGIAPAPSNAGGAIYAQGGARVALTPGITPPGLAERPVSTQITEYLSSRSGAADPNALYTVWAGGNDFFVNQSLLQAGQITAAQFQANILAAATAEVQQTSRLFQAGARHVMVVLNYDGAMTPAALTLDAATRAGITQLTAGGNTTILAGFASAGMRPIIADLFSLFNEIRANPSAFGFTNITGVACGPFPPASSSSSLFCLVGQNVAPNAQNTFLFADASGHLTTAGHRVVFQFANALIEGPYNYSLLAEAPLRTRTLHVHGVADGLKNAASAEVGRWTAFASIGEGDFDIDAASGNVGASNRNSSFAVGATIRTSPGVTLGAAYGQTKARGSFGADGGRYDIRDHNYSLFAGMRSGGFYGMLIGTLSETDYSSIRRNILIGSLLRVAEAGTSGSNVSGTVSAGYDFRLGRFTVGPTVSFTSQNVEINQFDEAGAGSSNLRIFGQKRRSEVLSAGVKASFDVRGWTPWIRVTADEEQRDDARFVTALPLTVLGTNSNYDVPAFVGDTSYTTIAGGIRGWFTPNVGLSVSYYNVSGRSGMSEQGGNATLSVKF